MNHILDVLSNNMEHTLVSIKIKLFHYLAYNFEGVFISTVGDPSFIFSSKKINTESTSTISDVGLNISELRILLQILRQKLGT